MASWADRLRSLFRRPSRGPTGPETYRSLRSLATEIHVASIRAPDGEPLRGVPLALMEIGLERGVATIVAIGDGTVSMYTSTGGGVIGAGGHAAVRGVAERFRIAMADARSLLTSTAHLPTPDPGIVCFHARTDGGDWTGQASEDALRRGRHPLSELYAAGQDLITEIRLSTPEGAAEADRPA